MWADDGNVDLVPPTYLAAQVKFPLVPSASMSHSFLPRVCRPKCILDPIVAPSAFLGDKASKAKANMASTMDKFSTSIKGFLDDL